MKNLSFNKLGFTANKFGMYLEFMGNLFTQANDCSIIEIWDNNTEQWYDILSELNINEVEFLYGAFENAWNQYDIDKENLRLDESLSCEDL